jgi:hypothetical protein
MVELPKEGSEYDYGDFYYNNDYYRLKGYVGNSVPCDNSPIRTNYGYASYYGYGYKPNYYYNWNTGEYYDENGKTVNYSEVNSQYVIPNALRNWYGLDAYSALYSNGNIKPKPSRKVGGEPNNKLVTDGYMAPINKKLEELTFESGYATTLLNIIVYFSNDPEKCLAPIDKSATYSGRIVGGIVITYQLIYLVDNDASKGDWAKWGVDATSYVMTCWIRNDYTMTIGLTIGVMNRMGCFQDFYNWIDE